MSTSNIDHEGLYLLRDIVSKRDGSRRGLFPISRSTWLKGVAEGRYPKPVQLSERYVAWRGRDLIAFRDSLPPAVAA